MHEMAFVVKSTGSAWLIIRRVAKEPNIQDDDNWIIMGDFNFYRSLEDRNRTGGDIMYTFRFNEAIGHLGMTGIPLKGCAYTWRNIQQDPLP